ncbi:MAG: DUF4097 family beta strand repeat-containing protein [Clostridia bacterium]
MPTLTAPAHLIVRVRRGTVAVLGEEREDVSFEASSPFVEVEQDGRQVELQVRDHADVELTVRIPARTPSLEVEVALGRVRLAHLRGRLSVDLASGSFRGEELSGDLDLDGGRADLVVDGMEGSLRIDAALGSVQVMRARGDLQVDAGAGSVQVMDGEVRGTVESGTGSIVLLGVAGTLDVESGLGSVDVENPNGLRLTVESAMGPVQIQGGRLTRLDASLARGNLRVHQSVVDGGEVEIAAGSADLRLDGRQPGRLEAIAHHGRVISALPRVRLPFSGAPRVGERVVLTFGDGPEMLTVQTRRGSITVERGRRDDEDIASDQSIMRERRLVLEELSAGRITADAARRLLDAIDRRP